MKIAVGYEKYRHFKSVQNLPDLVKTRFKNSCICSKTLKSPLI